MPRHPLRHSLLCGLALCAVAGPAATARAQVAVPDDALTIEAIEEIEDIDGPAPAEVVPAEAAATDPAAAALPDGLRRSLDPPRLNSVARPVQSALAPVRPVPPVVGGGNADEDPWQPLGLRAGNFVLLPTISAGGGYTSNAAGTAGGKGSSILTTSGALLLRSELERHFFEAEFKGSYTDYPDTDIEASPAFSGALRGGIDLTEVDRIDLAAGYALERESLSSEEVPDGATRTPTIEVFSGSAGYTREAGLLALAIKGSVDRSVYGNDAGYSSSDRTNTAYTGSLRVTLDNGAVLRPFLEAGVFRRLYDSDGGTDGFDRSSQGYELKGGLSVVGETLTGEIAAGWGFERLDDDRLDDIDSLIVDGALAWAATELSTITLDLGTSFAPTTLDGASGYVVTSLALGASHALKENVTVTLGAAATREDYIGVSRSVTTYSVSGGLGWKLNRNVELTATAVQSFDEESAGSDSRETRIEAGLTFRQ
ncbi:outer membrane beta-barrel protein [Methylobrevis pamukkalensis]|uniref:Outer membrane beta-barrel protein n=1 Tax=Methylobrevis pamukkalensis TaxID=1439726 RepID=A0A1E3H629_9HYPH|nr:outer membrane beta-barrel protein [Methylobrevis pamukkalensis]ODN70971.1 hypothetical protein A6302_01672 [Methylobrevis pamukkalensis]